MSSRSACNCATFLEKLQVLCGQSAIYTAPDTMDNLTPEQAQALWDAGGFLILSDLPEGSEFGIDGT